MVMNRRIYLRVITVIMMTLSTVKASAIDLISVDPLWNLAVLNGSDLVMKQYNQQTSKMLEVQCLSEDRRELCGGFQCRHTPHLRGRAYHA